jgi:adenylyltransferase/sulfurtransferase
MPRLIIPTPFRQYAGGKKVVHVNGTTVSEVMWSFAEGHPEIRRHLFEDGSHDLRPFVNLFLNGEDTRNLQGGKTPVNEADELRIIPSIAGGT